MAALFHRRYWLEDVSFARPKNEGFGWYLPFLLTLSMASAAIDVFSVPSLGVFTANNTGNLVFLMIAAGQIRDPGVRPIAAITSLVASWLGSFYSGQLGHRVGRAKRWFVFGDTLLGAVIAILCAGLYYRGALQFHDSRTEYATIALLSFTMGAQNVTTGGTQAPNTITTLVATGAMASFFSDSRLFAAHNRPRDERFAFVMFFFAGGLTGAFAFRYSSAQLCLLISGSFKFLAALAVLAVPPKVSQAAIKHEESAVMQKAAVVQK